MCCAADRTGTWYEAIVKQRCRTKGFQIHFQGWNSRHDEWLTLKDIGVRVRKFGTVECKRPDDQMVKKSKGGAKRRDRVEGSAAGSTIPGCASATATSATAGVANRAARRMTAIPTTVDRRHTATLLSVDQARNAGIRHVRPPCCQYVVSWVMLCRERLKIDE